MQAPAATVTETEAGGLQLNIDLGVLEAPDPARALARRLLGPRSYTI